MAAADIVIKGAREHNLRDVSLVLPRNQLICLTGVSGSGKSSLAFDTLYAEGQRRYVESLSTFARQFVGQMPKPDVDYISGLSPAISISQKTSGQNPRSTVGTITEIYDYLRLLYARVGQGHCPKCSRPITAQSREQIIDRIETLPAGTRFLVLAPQAKLQKGEFRDLFGDLRKQGFARARVDGRVVALSDDLRLDRQMRHTIEVVVDRLVAGNASRSRLAEAVETALNLGEGNLIVALDVEPRRATDLDPVPRQKSRGRRDEEEDSGAALLGKPAVAPDADGDETSPPPPASDLQLSAHYACTHCGLSFEPPSPQLFSFNSPQGMCPMCDGLGELYSFDPAVLIPDAKLSFERGAVELIGPWKDLGRWKRHLYDGVFETLERTEGLEAGSILRTPWQDLDPRIGHLLLFGTGDLHITYTWKHGHGVHKYGGRYEGLIPELLTKYRSSKSGMQRRQLEGYMSVIDCEACGGQRLNPQARSVTVTTRHARFADQRAATLPQVCRLAVSDAVDFFGELELDRTGQLIAAEVLKEIRARLGFLLNVGLDYLALDRSAPTLSGGESQRIRLASQIGSGLVGVLYILDEPSIGLHPRDNERLLSTLTRLRDLGNTVVVVEHDEDTMRTADTIIDFGPGPGVRGGHVVASGPLESICGEAQSVTGKYLSGEREIAVPTERRAGSGNFLRVVGAKHNNLRDVDVELPLGKFVCVTGVSGSGKSSLVNDILVEALHRDLNKGHGEPGDYQKIEGLEHLDKLIAIDQSPIGRTPRSNPSTYIKLFDDIRALYVQLPDAKARGYKAGRFSFNVKGGRCEACEGNGSNRLEMDFLADIWVTCPVCSGHRFNRETLQVRFKGKSIAEVLEMDVQEALTHFENVPHVRHKLQTLHDVGLDYLKLGQPSPTLSGGEAQRIKLARELVKKSTGRTLYLLDEPTTGLHFADVEMLLRVLHNFVDAGNTVLVVEHNLDVVKTADWLVDLGPEGGAAGGEIIAVGTPEEVAAVAGSHTGAVLRPLLERAGRIATPAKAGKNGKAKPGSRAGSSVSSAPRKHDDALLARSVRVQGARQHNLKGIDVDIPRDRLTVCCGLSGSGKSSLALDTVYAEGQRRYVESLSSYARQFVDQMQKPLVDHISGLSPAIAIEQKNMGHTPRSTVGTVTEIYDYLRILFARLGKPYCPACEVPIGTQTADEIIDKLLAYPVGTRLFLMAPLEVQVGDKYEALWQEIRAAGYVRMRVDGTTYSIDEPPTIDRRRKHRVEVVVDRAVVRPDARGRIADSVESALALGKGVLHVAVVDESLPETKWTVDIHSQHFACDRCGRSFEPLTPHNFSFNSWLGWCPDCEGLGTEQGANLSAIVPDGERTLREGAIDLWPDLALPMSQALLAALSAHTGVPLDVPFSRLNPRHRRALLYGTGEDWIDVPRANETAKAGGTRGRRAKPGEESSTAAGAELWFRFQFKGLYPALDEASRLSPSLRARLEHLVDEVECSACGGSRLRDDAAAARFRERTLYELCVMPLAELSAWFSAWKPTGGDRKVAGEIIREIKHRLEFLVDVGLDYLTLARPAPTLSGGEAQRIRLASQVGSGLVGVLYVLDEPTIGLHPRDNRRLLRALHKLRDLGNTLLVVEHDREVLASADQLLDFGPGAGEHGGQVVARGTPSELAAARASITGPYLSGRKAIGIPKNRRMQGRHALATAAEQNGQSSSSMKSAKATAKRATKAGKANSALTSDVSGSTTAGAWPEAPAGWLEIVGARHNNLKNVDVAIPLGTLTAVTGVSGSGKSSLVEDVLYNALARLLHRAATIPGAFTGLRGVEQINKVIRVDQQALGNTPTSNPATYTGAFDLIRNLFAQLPDSKVRGYTARRFSFNVPGGRCESCEGNGQRCVEMHFLPDVWVECDTCRGKRYNPETLDVKFRGHSIADVLEMPCGRAVELFENIPGIRRILRTLCDVGLDYITLGQSAPTLSGGEAQRVKLAAELSRPDTGRTLYLLDEPTTGLHFDDLAKLLDVLGRLVDLGNTVVVIEHNLDVIKTADWIIDIGPEAGAQGGYVVAAGTPEDLVEHARQASDAAAGNGSAKHAAKGRDTSSEHESPARFSHTGQLLADVLAAGPYTERRVFDFAAAEAKRSSDVSLEELGRNVSMPWEEDGRRWHTLSRVGRNGEPCRWEGEILARVVDRIQDSGHFADTNWNNRTIVEISGEKKSDGWFFHALTGHEWLLTLKFRVAKRTFKREELIAALDLKPLNEIPDLPVYGSEPRVKCKQLRGPWQEVQLIVHSLAEVDRPAFWKFLEDSIAGFVQFTERVKQDPEDVMPWKVLGQKWHLSRKGFPPGKKVSWETEVLEELCERLAAAAPEGQFLWNNQQVVHLRVPGQDEPWATIHTKRRAAVELTLTGPKGRFALGRIAGLGAARELDTSRRDKDLVKLAFVKLADLARGELDEFLKEHLSELASAAAR
ncbi:MAG: excinuclease ABC subunit UvrA [Pirellulales bacterium]|nr:excinuclease ABC subunit UvrA [Pirellulales bacterium]